MNNSLELIIKNFNITEQVLSDRKSIGLYVESLSSLIVDKIYDYFLSNADFAKLIDPKDIPMLKRMRAQFIVSLFNDDFDEALFEKIKQAYKDSPVRPNSYLIASSFELIMQSIIDIASVNHQLQRGLKTIYKFLHIAEFIMQKEFINDNTQKATSSKNAIIDALESLFEMLSIHKGKHELLLECYKKGSFESCYSKGLPSRDVVSCRFNDVISHTKELVSNIDYFSMDIDTIDEWHTRRTRPKSPQATTPACWVPCARSNKRSFILQTGSTLRSAVRFRFFLCAEKLPQAKPVGFASSLKEGA
jgi:hypothetical protein